MSTQDLLDALRSPNTDARKQAIEDVSKALGIQAVEHIQPLLNDPDEFVRIYAVRALGEIADRSAIAALQDAKTQASSDLIFYYENAIAGIVARGARLEGAVLGGPGPKGGIIFYLDDSGLHGLEANSRDSGCKMWPQAVDALSRSGGGRLPTVRELRLLVKMKDLVGGFEDGHYWSSEVDGILGSAVVFPWGNTNQLRAYHDSRRGVDAAYIRGVHDF